MLLVLAITVILLALTCKVQAQEPICTNDVWDCLVQDKTMIVLQNATEVVLRVINKDFQDKNKTSMFYTMESTTEDHGGFFLNTTSETLIGEISWRNGTMSSVIHCKNTGSKFKTNTQRKEDDNNGDDEDWKPRDIFDEVQIE